jgi:hypothetical protein
MSRRARRLAVLTAIGPPLLMLGLLTGRLDAAHFAWLGHSACPEDSARCESQVPAGFKLLGDFDYGVYRILDEASAEWRGEARTQPLRTREGQLIARVGARFRRQLDLEGSARLRDGRVVTVEGKVDGQSRFLIIEQAPFGIGMPGYKLVPYRTVSVDPKRIALGTVLFIPALVGVRLPSGEFHDGFCFAHDTHEGAADDIGIFAGFDRDPEHTVKRLAEKKLLRVYQADTDASAVLNRRFKDQFEWSG